MSHSVTLSCGCDVHVACHPITGMAHSRVIERRDARCRIRSHDIGTRVWLWELLPGSRATGHREHRAPSIDAPGGHSLFGLK